VNHLVSIGFFSNKNRPKITQVDSNLCRLQKNDIIKNILGVGKVVAISLLNNKQAATLVAVIVVNE